MNVDGKFAMLVSGLTSILGLINLILVGVLLGEWNRLTPNIDWNAFDTLFASLLIGSMAALLAGPLMAAFC
jgi:hypothetical protein